MTTPKKIVTIQDWTGLGGKKSLEQISKLFDIVYVAGPMSGYELFNFPAFDQGRDYVNDLGLKVAIAEPTLKLAAVSPADMDRAHGFDPVAASADAPVVSSQFFHDCMRRDMEVVSRSYAILLMRGWRASTGANHELFFARACGVHVWLATYDHLGNIDGHVVAPEWLRSPLIYGDDGNPAISDPPALTHTGVGLTEDLSPQGSQALVTEVDQSIEDIPAIPPALDYGHDLGVYPPRGQIETKTVTKVALPNILAEAEGLIYGERNADYGHPIEDFSRTGIMWSGTLRDWALTVTDPQNVPPVPPHLVGLCMVNVKVSREVNKHKRDNLTDIAGYAGTVDMVATYVEEHPEEFA